MFGSMALPKLEQKLEIHPTTTLLWPVPVLYPTVQKLCRNSFFFNFLAKKTEFGRVYKPKQEFR